MPLRSGCQHTLWDGAGHVISSLGGLQGHAAVHAVARVELEGILVGINIELDAGPGAAKTGDGWCAGVAPIIWSHSLAVGDVASVVSSAALTAVAVEGVTGRREVGTDLLGRRPEVVARAGLVGQDVTSGDQDAVRADTGASIGHPQGVVLDRVGLGVGEAIQIPVGLQTVSKEFADGDRSPKEKLQDLHAMTT